MKRSNRFILRTTLALLSGIVGVIVAMVRIAQGRDFYTCLVVAYMIAWALMPGSEERKAFRDALGTDGEQQ